MKNNDETTMRENLFSVLDNLESALATTPDGSDKHTAITKEIEIIVKLIELDYQTANTIDKDQAHQELEYKRFVSESNIKEREIEIKESQADAGAKWYNQQIIKYLLGTSILTSGTIFMAILNCKTETPIINSVAVGMQRLLGAVER